MDPQPQTLCKKCSNYIRTKNFLIHSTRCNGMSSQQSRPSTRQLNTHRVNNNANRIKTQNNIEEEQRIPCHFCSYPQTLKQLDTHPSICQHREQECSNCHNSFPKSLLSQHHIVCPANRRHEQQQSFQYDEDQSQELSQPSFVFRRNSEPFHMIMHRMIQDMEQIPRNQSQRIRSNRRQRTQPQGRRITLLNNLQELIRLLAEVSNQQQHGLTKQEIKKFPIEKFNLKLRKQGQQAMCVICYCQFQQGQQYMCLPCKHIFHPQCVTTWLLKNSTCPLCKKNYSSKSKNQEQEEQQQQRPRNGLFLRRIFRS